MCVTCPSKWPHYLCTLQAPEACKLMPACSAYCRKESRYSEADAAGTVRQMLNVVALCHLNGVVHRDLKPEVPAAHTL